LNRFGANCTTNDDNIIIIGGVISGVLLPQDCDFLVVRIQHSRVLAVSKIKSMNESIESIPRPLFVGSSIVTTENKHVVVMGGGATCFSMGAFWTKGNYAISLKFESPTSTISSSEGPQKLSLEHCKTVEMVSSEIKPLAELKLPSHQVRSIPRTQIRSGKELEDVISKGKPVIIEKLNLGQCTEKWNLDYLTSQIGPTEKVSVLQEVY
jgi:tRNA wybutosine-synthesizing protein 4